MKKKNLPTVKGKVWARDPRLLLRTADAIRNLFAPYAVISGVLPSREGDFHVNFSIYEFKSEEPSATEPRGQAQQ